MDDDDYEDLLGEDDQDVPIQDDAMQDSSSAAIIPDMPSANELRLGQKVAHLEAERTQLLAQIDALKSRQVSGPTIPIPTQGESASRQIVIPHDLLPTLQLLRTHIGELTRDNEALRYTFIGRSQEASSSKVTLDHLAAAQKAIPGGVQGVDLGKVVERVKELLRENEELGEMILAVGKSGSEEYEKTLNDSRKIIESLESDLEQHAKTVQALRADLVAYRTHFGPVPSKDSRGTSSSTSAQSKPDTPRDHRDRNRDRPNDRRTNEPPNAPNASNASNTPNAPRASTGPQDRELSIRGMSNQTRQSPDERRGDRRPDSGRSGQGYGNSRGDDKRDDRSGGGRRRDDDRGSKRRR